MKCVIHDCLPAAGKVQMKDWCAVRDPERKWWCSRKPNHSGDHIACARSRHELCRWANTVTAENAEKENPMDTEALVELLDQAKSEHSDATDYVDSAQDQAQSAENEAYEARNSASRAEDYAIEAKDRAEDAQSSLGELAGTLDELGEAIAALTGDAVSRDLKGEIKHWMPRAQPLLLRGNTHSAIASNLGISEFLVQCIADEIQKESEAA